MNLTKFKANKGLWVASSVIAFGLCWLYPMHFGKEGTFPLGRLWVDFFRGTLDYWLPLVLFSAAFGLVAALLGFVIQAVAVLLRSRSAQPKRLSQ